MVPHNRETMEGIRRILLIGYRATGKSTVGRLLAEALGWHFLDMDQEIKGRIQMDISRFVEERGWEAFRTEEKRLLREILDQRDKGPMVVATGGGVVLHQDLLSKLPQDTLVVWLKATPETIEARMAHDKGTSVNRPPLTQMGSAISEIREVLREREPLYSRFSHVTIQCDTLQPNEIKEKILSHAR